MMHPGMTNRVFIAAACLAALFACGQQTIFQESRSPDPGGWPADEVLKFQTHIADSLSLHELFLIVRNNTDYAYSNLFLFLDIHMPDGTSLRDTIECFLADRSGQWTGKGFGSVRSNQFLFRDDVWFPLAGTYTFGLQHGMREEKLEGITDIGIRIDKK